MMHVLGSMLLLGGRSAVQFDLGSVPPIDVGGRVVDLLNGDHFDDLLQDAPDAIRPPTIIAFYNSSDPTCLSAYNALGYQKAAEDVLPARERLLIAKYDTGYHQRRAWYQFTKEKDLPTRFGVESCPSIVFLPRKCSGWTEWCLKDGAFGCENYKEQCSDWKIWSKDEGKGDKSKAYAREKPWVRWVMHQVDEEGEPALIRSLGTFAAQGRWLHTRSESTTNNHLRNAYLFVEIPQYTPTGFEVHPTPKAIGDRLDAFYKKWEQTRYTEAWDTWGSTQLSFHETPTTMVSLDKDPAERDYIANQLVKPLLEKWSGEKLHFNAFYGFREYPEGAFLHPHLDRVDTHVISATFSVAKLNVTDPSKDWPLVVVDPQTGQYASYVHLPGQMIYYESSKVIHGRPTRNPVGGGVHVGCFVHFSVVGGNYEELKERAKQAVNAKERRVMLKSSPSVEPTNPVYYDLPSELNTHESAKNKNQKRTDGKFGVQFLNDMPYPIYLFWVNDGAIVPQGSVGPGDTLPLDTFAGHQFLASKKRDSKTVKIVNSRIFTIAARKTHYRISELRGFNQKKKVEKNEL